MFLLFFYYESLKDVLNSNLLIFNYISNKEINEIKEIYFVSLIFPILFLPIIKFVKISINFGKVKFSNFWEG